MSDLEYERYREDDGIHDATVNVDVLNEGCDAKWQFIMESYSGAPEDVSEELWEAVHDALDHDTDDETFDWFVEELDGGDWVTIVDGRLVEYGEFHPHRVSVSIE